MKHGNMTIVYGLVAALSIALLASYFLGERKKDRSFLHLFLCVAIANSGYFLLAVSGSLTVALIANAISYFGAAYCMLAMVYIILDVCQMKQRKWLRWLLFSISTAAFLLAASGKWLGLYYRGAQIIKVNGMTRLVKDYGPLHILYTVYLLSYVVLMIATIAYAAKKKRLASGKYTMLLLAAVLLNVGVWAVEQAIDVDFEFLSVSYMVTEMILLLVYSMLRDYGIVQSGGKILSAQMLASRGPLPSAPGALPPGMEDMFHSFAEKAKTLSSAERRILNYYIEGHEISDIPELAYISIHTVKKHNRSIYQKLNVASRDELMLYIEFFRCCGRLDELTGGAIEME